LEEAEGMGIINYKKLRIVSIIVLIAFSAYGYSSAVQAIGMSFSSLKGHGTYDKELKGIYFEGDRDIILIQGQETVLPLSLSPKDAENVTLEWKSENTSIAQVGQDGRVRALRPGIAKIVVYGNEKYAAFCRVTVISKGTSSVVAFRINNNNNQVEVPSDIILGKHDINIYGKGMSISLTDGWISNEVKNSLAHAGGLKFFADVKRDKISSISPVYTLKIKDKDRTITELGNKAKISIKYDAKRVGNPMRLKLYHYDEQYGNWMPVEAEVDTLTEVISGRVQNLGKFVVVEQVNRDSKGIPKDLFYTYIGIALMVGVLARHLMFRE